MTLNKNNKTTKKKNARTSRHASSFSAAHAGILFLQQFTSLPSYLCSSSSVNKRTGFGAVLCFTLASSAKATARMINKTQNRAVAMARSLFKQEVQAETSSSTSLSMPRYSLVVMHLKASEISPTLF